MMTTAIIPVLMAIFLTPPAGEESRLFWATYKSNQSTDSARIEAIHGLSSRPTLAGAKVLGRLLLVAPESHRIEAARALTKFRGMKRASVLVAWALQHRANRKRTAVRVELVKTLGSLREKGALPLLHNLLKDRDVVVKRAAIEAIPPFGNKRSLRLLIDALKKSERTGGKVGADLNKALRTLTNRSWTRSQEWNRWLESTQSRSAIR